MDKRQARLRAIAMLRRRDRRHSRGGQPWWLYLGFIVSALILTTLLSLPFLALGATTAVAAGASTVAYNMFSQEVRAGIEAINSVNDRELFESTRIYDRNGVLLYEIVDQGRRTPVTLDGVPQILIDATVATEDDTFWENPGFDPVSAARAVVQNLTGGRILSGFSTITQQLVRHVAFSYEERIGQSYERKIKEVVLAWVMTQRMSKRDILQTYLNEIYYGNLAYGIEAAANTFFGKSARDLNAAEATFLVGLPSSPIDLDPFTDSGFQRSRARQKVVLGLMVRHGYLNQAEADAIYDQGVRLLPQDKRQIDIRAPHFVTYARRELEERFGVDRVNRGGLQVTTTVDVTMQETAQEIARRQVAQLAAQNVTNAAVVALKNDTGEILTMLGSVDYWDNKIDGRVNVAIAERQPGSSIKPLTYITALEQGVTAADIIWDVKHKEKLPNNQVYEPQNYDEKFHGPVHMRTALANSYNIPAIKLIKQAGVQETIDTAHKVGITGLNRGTDWYGLSLTLGGGEVTLLDMTTAYSTMARMGTLVRPTSILKVTDGSGNILYEYQPPTPEQVLKPASAYIITDYLSDEQARIPAFGPNSPLKLTQPAAVKTGTTNDYRDNWTLGYTPYMTIGVWAGNSDNSPMIKSSGVTGAAPIWHDLFEDVFRTPQFLNALRSSPEAPLRQAFPRPPGIVESQVCAAAATCGRMERELFIEGTVTKDQSKQWTAAPVVEVKGADEKVRYCRDTAADATAHSVRFVALPKDAEEQKEAVAWLRQAGWPTAPTVDCTPEWIALASAGVDPNDKDAVAKALEEGRVVATPSARAGAALPPPPPAQQGGGMALTTGYRALIASPANDGLVKGAVPVSGVVEFNPAEIDFFKVEYRPQNRDWITIGNVQRAARSGTLETWHTEALAPGAYQVRLVLVKKDGNFIVPSQVTVRVEP